MPIKEDIFDNISQYSASEIVGYIHSGLVTLDELKDPYNTAGQFKLLEDEVNKLLGVNPPKPDVPVDPPIPSDDWDKVNKQDINSLQAYIDTHGDSPNKSMAQRLVNKLRNIEDGENLLNLDLAALVKKIKNIQADKNVLNPSSKIFELIEHCVDKNSVTLDELRNAIAEDKNLLIADVVCRLYHEGFLNRSDFQNMNVKDDFVVHMLQDVQPQRFQRPEPLNQVNKSSTEIYFWGIPSSGKSCALGAIMSVANNGKVAKYMDIDNDCQGYGYMSRLMLLFDTNGGVCTLPEGTSIYSTYEMGFNLVDCDDKIHPITCIDLAGELVRCMYKYDSGETMSNDEVMALDTLTNVLVDNKTKNRKVHFFVIEYGAEDRMYEGMPQKSYLTAALQYIKRTRIFEKNTDAIFVLISKADKMPVVNDKNTFLRNYIDDNYKGFINGLKELCVDHEINNGRVEVIPFTLGEVCFQNYCRFNDASATVVVNKILQRTVAYKKSKYKKFLKAFEG